MHWRYYLAKVKSKITNLSNIESWLIEIGNNSVISTGVEFVLHDFSISRVIPGKSNLYGKIIIR